jgi:hypothetical protein
MTAGDIGFNQLRNIANEVSYGNYQPFRNTRNIQTMTLDPDTFDVATMLPIGGVAAKVAKPVTKALGRDAMEGVVRLSEKYGVDPLMYVVEPTPQVRKRIKEGKEVVPKYTKDEFMAGVKDLRDVLEEQLSGLDIAVNPVNLDKAAELYKKGFTLPGARIAPPGQKFDKPFTNARTPGSHFASLESPDQLEGIILNYLEHQNSVGGQTEAGRVLKGTPSGGLIAAKMENPIFISDEAGEMFPILAKETGLTEVFREKGSEGLLKALNEMGVEGAVYRNLVEGAPDEARNLSYTMFDPKKFKKVPTSESIDARTLEDIEAARSYVEASSKVEDALDLLGVPKNLKDDMTNITFYGGRYSQRPEVMQWLNEKGLTPDEFKTLYETTTRSVPGYAAGGLVANDYDEEQIDQLANSIFETKPTEGGVSYRDYPNPYGLRAYPTKEGSYGGEMLPKTEGWAGEQTGRGQLKGSKVTEYSMDDERGSFPTINPLLSLDEIDAVAAGNVTPEIERKAIEWRDLQARHGQSAFKNPTGFAEGGVVDKIARAGRKGQYKIAELIGLRPEVEFATEIPERYYPANEQHNARGDAMRHMLLQAQLMQKYGETPAKIIGWMHENLSGPQGDAEKAMDEYNDRLGREIGRVAKDKADMAYRAMQAIDKQQAKTLTKEQMGEGYAEGGLVYNDEEINNLADQLLGA